MKDYDSTRGNNVYAQPDLDGKNTTLRNAPRSSTSLPDLTFNFTPFFNGDPIEEPATTNFGVTNLFYWMNIILTNKSEFIWFFERSSKEFEQ